MKEIELNLNNYISDDKEDKKIKKEIIEYEGKNNLVIIACAGAGKTSTMVERIIYLLNKNVDPKSIVVFTYTNMAATELTLRIHSKAKEINKDILVSQIFIGTIHSFCQNLLKELSSEYKNCNLLDETQFSLFCYRYFNEIKLCDYLPFERKYNNHIKNSFTIIDYMKLIDLINENYIFLENEKIEELPQQLKWIYESLRKQMISKNRKTIFSFILRDIVEKLKTDNDIKKMFLEKKIKYLIVDEYQDMNKVQEALVEQMHILGAQVYAVGDDDQAIYKFRGGDNKWLLEFKERYKDTIEKKLLNNYRSSPAIVAIANMHISEKNTHGHNRIEKEIKSGNAEKIPYTIGDIQLNTFNCIDDELNDIINKIKLIKQNNLPYNEIAIIVRDFNKISLITKKLNENNIPFNLSKDTLLDEKEHEWFSFIRKLVLIKKGAIFSCKDNKKIDEKIENLVSQLNFLSVNEKKIIKEKTINLRNIYFENKLIFDDYYTIVKEIINEDIIASNEILKYILYDLRLLNDVNENNNRQIFIEKIKEKYNVGKYPKSYVLYRFFKLLKLWTNENDIIWESNLIILTLYGKTNKILVDKTKNLILKIINKMHDLSYLKNTVDVQVSLFDIFFDLLETIEFPKLIETLDDEELNRIALFTEKISNFESINYDLPINTKIHSFIEFIERPIEITKNKNKKENSINIMTMHSSKGLEFHTVFLPFLQEKNKISDELDNEDDKYSLWKEIYKILKIDKYDESDQERNLFYVAITRAKKHLFMSCVENETNNMLIYALNLSKYNLIKKNNDNKQLNLEINTNILKNKDKDNYVKLSYTSYMDYIFCPFFYKLNYINNFKTKKMNEKYFGDSAHICIWYIINTLKENNIKKQNVDIEKIIDDAINNHAFFPDNTNEYNKNCSELKEILLKNFIPYINNCDIDKITSELVFKWIVNENVVLVGAIDIVDNSNTKTKIIDIKTGKTIPTHEQLFFYSAAYKYINNIENNGEIMETEIFNIRTGNKEKESINDECIKKIKEKIILVGEKIKNNIFNKNKENCNLCPFKKICNN